MSRYQKFLGGLLILGLLLPSFASADILPGRLYANGKPVDELGTYGARYLFNLLGAANAGLPITVIGSGGGVLSSAIGEAFLAFQAWPVIIIFIITSILTMIF
ncbi:MAG: hypothetical protein HYT34_01900, partial [Candidatus Ryanbacteria bacterium]|nr:hypothetical protein [Candidatus Ryanbacteria bacterium]